MTLDVDSYLGRRFDLTRQNCWHIAREAWLDLTGIDIGDRTPQRITTASLLGRFDHDVPTEFEVMERPAEPCLVLMRRPGEVPHVGVFTRGHILQMQESGVTFLPVDRAVTGFTDVGYYRPCLASSSPKTRSDPTHGKSSKAI